MDTTTKAPPHLGWAILGAVALALVLVRTLMESTQAGVALGVATAAPSLLLLAWSLRTLQLTRPHAHTKAKALIRPLTAVVVFVCGAVGAWSAFVTIWVATRGL